MPNLIYPPSQNGLQKQLDADLNSGVTASMTLTNTTGVQNKPGVVVINRIDTNGNELASSSREYISFTGTSGATLTGLARGLGGTSDQDHSTGAVVEFMWDVVGHQAINDVITAEHGVDGTHTDVTATTVTTTGNVDAATLKVATSTVSADDILDEDDFASNSATALITQQSAKAYVDTYGTSSSMARQAIINGNFDIWQRGTSLAISSSGTYLADRWFVGYGLGGGTLPTDTVSRQLLTSGALANSFYHWRLNVDGSGSGFGTAANYSLAQNIEHGTRNLCGASKTVTLSFYAKSDIADKKLGVFLLQTYGTTGSPTAAETIAGTNWTLTSSWTKYTHTFTTNTLDSKTFGTDYNDYLQVNFQMMWGTDYDDRVGASGAEDFGGSGNIDIAQVQLCAGSVALPFQPKSYIDELRSCQFGQPIYRQGGSAISWDTTGTTSYFANAFIQCGTCTVTNSSTPADVTFPIPFKTGTIPLMVCTVVSSADVNVMANPQSNTNAYVYSNDPSIARAVSWIAIGEADGVAV